MLLDDTPHDLPLLLLATADAPYGELVTGEDAIAVADLFACVAVTYSACRVLLALAFGLLLRFSACVCMCAALRM